MPDTYEMLEARQLMAAEQYDRAYAMLEKTPAEERDGAWYYLRSQIEEKQACYYNSVTSLKKAIELEPENKEYKAALKAMEKSLKKALRKDSASQTAKAAGMAAGFGSVCDSFKNKDCSGCFEACGEICCEGCGEGCCECIGESACDGCDCDCS